MRGQRCHQRPRTEHERGRECESARCPQRAQGVASGPLESVRGPGVGPIGLGDQPPVEIDMAASTALTGLVVQLHLELTVQDPLQPSRDMHGMILDDVERGPAGSAGRSSGRRQIAHALENH